MVNSSIAFDSQLVMMAQKSAMWTYYEQLSSRKASCKLCNKHYWRWERMHCC